MMEKKAWKMRGLVVSVCLWMHMCNTSSLSLPSHFIQLWSGNSQNPHKDFNEGTGLECF